MIAAWLAGFARAAHGTAGIAPGVVAASSSAAPVLDPTLGLWAAYGPRPWGIAIEAQAWRRVEGARPWDPGSSLYRFDATTVRGVAYAEVALGTHATTFHAGLGPAVTEAHTRIRYRRAAGADADLAATEVDPGIAGRVALDGPLGRGLAWQWRVGITSRRLDAVDYDAALGLGVAW